MPPPTPYFIKISSPQVHEGAGFQSLLAEGVQGRVEFGVRGPRLNDSKQEKGSVVYSKDHRLHWRVTAPMPKIVVSMEHVCLSLCLCLLHKFNLTWFPVRYMSSTCDPL